MLEPRAYIARYYFETAALPPDTFQVVDFVGSDAISQLFQFDVNLVSQDSEIDFAEVINKPATLTLMRDDEPVRIHGLIADIEQGGRTADWVAYRVSLVPRVWLLSLNYQSRVFQNMTVEEIVTKVLKDAGFSTDDYRFALSETYPAREYCVQYRETDLNFIRRLLEFEGIYFFFEHDEEREAMIITDDGGESAMIEGESSIGYHSGAGMISEEAAETVSQFICREKIVPGKVILKDYNYRTPETNLLSESQLNRDMPGTYYEYGQHFKDPSEGDRLARVRNEEIECSRRVMTGDSNCVAFRSGFKFSLRDHYRSDLNGDYLLVSVSHQGAQGAGFGVGGEHPTYRNDFVCIPADVPYRPPRTTPVPRIPGIMTAKVESAGGEYAYIDEMGRYRVKMPFDLSDNSNGTASRPIRLAEPYTGPNYGIHFPNHANTEMVWACIDGNVDRPLGLSTVPNPSQTSPVNSGNHSQNVIKTAADNQLVMEDQAGNEQILISSPYANSLVCLGAPHTSVDGITVSTDRVTCVHGKQGVYITAWGAAGDKGQFASELNAGLAAAGFLAGAASALGAGSFGALGAILGAAGAFASWTSPSVLITAPAGIGMLTPNVITGIAAAGIGLFTAAAVDVCAGAGILLTAANGINLFSKAGGIRTIASSGDLILTAKSNNIQQFANEDFTVESLTGHIGMVASAGNIDLKAQKVLTLVAEEEGLQISAKKDSMLLDAEKSISIRAKTDRLALVAEQEIALKCGQSTIILKKDGTITLKGLKINISGTQAVNIDGANVKVDAKVKTAVSGSIVESAAKGPNIITGTPVKLN